MKCKNSSLVVKLGMFREKVCELSFDLPYTPLTPKGSQA